MLLERVKGQQDAAAHPDGFQLFDQWRADEPALSRVEQTLSARLPAEYREFMTRVGGGMFLYVDLLPVVSSDPHEDDLLSVNDELKLSDFVAVAPVGTGDWWGFRVSSGICDPEVSFWDHEDGSFSHSAESWLGFLVERGLGIPGR